MANHPLRVLVADDHPLVADMLERIIDGDARMELVKRCANGAEAIEAIESLHPDVAVLDVDMPRGGPELAEQIADGDIPTSPLFLTGDDDATMLYRCLVAGARGFLLKTASREVIAEAIVTVGGGGTVFPPGATEALIRGRETEQQRVALTPRELEVVSLAADGNSIADTAQTLFIGQTTVKSHLHTAAEKLGVQGRAATVAEALRRGLVT
jgi:two-component system, NarL family, nitrate/nitrite response regulator NarL